VTDKSVAEEINRLDCF